MEVKWNVRPYEDGDENGIKDLFDNSVSRQMEDKEWFEWWNWQHKDIPSTPPLVFFADADGTLAGQYEIIRFRVKYDGKERIGFHSQDTMTHRDFRRQGIFKTLAAETYRQAGEDGGVFVFGFPNQNSHPGFIKKLDFFDVCKVPNVFKPLNVTNTVNRRIKNGFLRPFAILAFKLFFTFNGLRPGPRTNKDIQVTKVSRFDERVDDLWKRASPDYDILVVRDRDHVNWRYADIPHRKYDMFIAEVDGRVAGYIVLSLVEKEGFTGGEIVDIFAEIDESVIGSLIGRSVEHFKSKGADAVYSWLPEMKAFKDSFSKLGFIKMTPDPPMIARTLQDDVPDEVVKDYGKWFVMMGDSDFH